MKVLCSGEEFKEPISEETCLDCARTMNGFQPCGYSLALLKGVFKGSEDRSNEIHVTDLNSCLRKAYYGKINKKPEFIHEMQRRFIGNAIHHYLEEVAGDEIEAELPVENNGVVGKIDAFSNETITDFKTTRWINPRKLPYGNHIDQLNYYKALFENNGKKAHQLHVQYIDMSGPSICRKCRVPLQLTGGLPTCPKCGKVISKGHLGAVIVNVPIKDKEEVVAEITDKRQALEYALKEKAPPEGEPSWLCNYCPHNECEFAEYIR